MQWLIIFAVAWILYPPLLPWLAGFLVACLVYVLTVNLKDYLLNRTPIR